MDSPGNGNGPRTDVEVVYEALNASYRMWDEYLRQSQRLAEDLWMPWLRPFLDAAGPDARGASPFIPPEQWIRAYGDMAMMWMSMAQAWTNQWSRWDPARPPDGGAPPPFTPEGRAVDRGGRSR